VGRKQAVQIEGVALRLSERSALVQARIHEQIETGKAGANGRIF